MARWKQWVCLACCALLLSGCSKMERETPPRLAPIEGEEQLEVTYFNCGKADSILVRQGEHAMLIDAATDKESSGVLARLAAMGVKKLDVLLITHGDKDHVGGADHILRTLPVEHVYVGQIVEISKQVQELDRALEEQKKMAVQLKLADQFSLGMARISVIGPRGTAYEQENDYSLVLRVDFGQTTFLFTGDAEKPSLLEMMNADGAGDALRAQVLKVPHHGGAESVSARFFEMVGPQIAVICSARNAGDGLPEETVLAGLAHVGAATYVTGDGEVTVISDGKTVQAVQGTR